MHQDRRSIRVEAPPDAVYSSVCLLGGDFGWHSPKWLWRFRGVMDKWLGGDGFEFTRRDPEHIEKGDALDFWEVVRAERPHHVRLHTFQTRLGEATLHFEITGAGNAASRLTQTALFQPYGILGNAYWYAAIPIHHFVFGSMIEGIADTAVERFVTGAKEELDKETDQSG